MTGLGRLPDAEGELRAALALRRAGLPPGHPALGYTLPGDWNLRVSAGNAYRNPNVFDLYASSVTGSGIVFASNPALQPETVVSWEAGLRKRLGARTSVDAAYYQNHVKDLIYRQTDLDRDPTGNYRVNVNAGGGRTRGVELAFRQDLMPGWQFRSTYTFTNAIVTSNPANPAIVGNFLPDNEEHSTIMRLLIAVEEMLLASGTVTSDFTIMVMRPRLR